MVLSQHVRVNETKKNIIVKERKKRISLVQTKNIKFLNALSKANYICINTKLGF